ncbi:hypothetical protein R3P38DRAFT_3193902 [Favolaschia claudopus]|uniref:Uncharacterized protein n=1 Tax=Favolaschia claudopus TaxID=2862362 RepID=A0AAW0BFN6_9AGAR
MSIELEYSILAYKPHRIEHRNALRPSVARIQPSTGATTRPPALGASLRHSLTYRHFTVTSAVASFQTLNSMTYDPKELSAQQPTRQQKTRPEWCVRHMIYVLSPSDSGLIPFTASYTPIRSPSRSYQPPATAVTPASTVIDIDLDKPPPPIASSDQHQARSTQRLTTEYPRRPLPPNPAHASFPPC